MSRGTRPTVWVLGDQLNTGITSLEGRRPGECRVLFVASKKIMSDIVCLYITR